MLSCFKNGANIHELRIENGKLNFFEKIRSQTKKIIFLPLINRTNFAFQFIECDPDSLYEFY